MLFSEKYKIEKSWEKEWFDPILDSDTKLFIDPLLVFRTKIPEFSKSKEKIRKFFQFAFEEVARVRKKGINELEKVNSLLSFREPKELLLGYTSQGSAGRGIGEDFSKKIRDAIIEFIDYGLEDLAEYVGTFTLIVEGIGPDGISDLVANIIKDDLVEYTRRICLEENIETAQYLVNNLGYDYDLKMWRRERVSLPKNSIYPKNPVILVPKEILRANEAIELKDLEYYLARIPNKELRIEASRLFTTELDTNKIRNALDQDPITSKKVLKSYLESLENSENLSPYNFDFDPNLIYKFEIFLSRLKENLPKKETLQKDKDSLKQFVNDVIDQYKLVIENRESYWLLYNEDDQPKSEDACQRLFWAIAETMCLKNREVVINRESQTGRGPVDFRFSNGYPNKIIVELKHVKSPKIFPGLEKQLITYINAEGSDYGYYLVIKLKPQDTARFYRLKMRFDKLKEEDKRKIIIRDIDARIDNKVSASKL